MSKWTRLKTQVEALMPIVSAYKSISRNALKDVKTLQRYKKFEGWASDVVYGILLKELYRMRMDYARTEKEYFYYRNLLTSK